MVATGKKNRLPGRHARCTVSHAASLADPPESSSSSCRVDALPTEFQTGSGNERTWPCLCPAFSGTRDLSPLSETTFTHPISKPFTIKLFPSIYDHSLLSIVLLLYIVFNLLSIHYIK